MMMRSSVGFSSSFIALPLCLILSTSTVINGFTPSLPLTKVTSNPSFIHPRYTNNNHNNHFKQSSWSPLILYDATTASTDYLESVSQTLEQSTLESGGSGKKISDITKTCKVQVGPSKSGHRLGLVATSQIKKGEVMLSMPYDDLFVLTPELAKKQVFAESLPEGYDGWTGDVGFIAMLVLNELAKASSNGSGIPLPKRSAMIDNFMASWVKCLPSLEEMKSLHPLLWSEDDQEILQSSSTSKIYQSLDDCEEDATWLIERIWSKDRQTFPEYVTLGNAEEEIPCFTTDGFKWAMAIAQSRSVFTDGSLRLIPYMDMCNHNDRNTQEVTGGFMGTFGTTKGAQLTAAQDYSIGDEVFCSYGPKSAADYLLEHGFCPPQTFKTAVSELTFELDSEDRFYDDKLDILEFETYELAPMDPVQSFDIVSEIGRDGEPDPAMIQFVRLCKVGGTDSFLLESIFRKEVWGFMSLPVSEPNELAVTNTIIDACQKALDDMAQAGSSNDDSDAETLGVNAQVCKQLRESETKALTRTMEYLLREKEALDLKEYYQERRLKDLGLDSEWAPEDDVNPDLGFGQTRLPGGADYDW